MTSLKVELKRRVSEEMKLTWNKKKKKKKKRPLEAIANLPFDHQEPSADDTLSQNQETSASEKPSVHDLDSNSKQLAQLFQDQGNQLAVDGKFREALGKWEAALNLMPENAVLHEQKAQILLEIGDTWSALKAATRATELEPSWAEAWITLGRAQLNFGEPDSAIESFDRALAIKSDSVEAQDDRKSALHLIKRRKLLHSSGLSVDKNRYIVGDKNEPL